MSNTAPVALPLSYFYKALYPSLTRSALRLAQSPDQAEDLVQEAVLRLLKNATLTFTSNEAAFAFIHTTMKHLAIDLYRKSKVRKTNAVGADIDAAYENSDIQHKQTDRRMTLVATLAITNALSDISDAPGSEVLSMFYLQGLTAKEIGKKTGETVGTVTSKISRQRQKHAPMIKTQVEAAWAMYA